MTGALLVLGSAGIGTVVAILMIAKLQTAASRGTARDTIWSIVWAAVLAGASAAAIIYFAGMQHLASLALGGGAASFGYFGLRDLQRASARMLTGDGL